MMKWLEQINTNLAKRFGPSISLACAFSIMGIIGYPAFFIAYIHTERWWLNGSGTLISLLTLLCVYDIGIKKKYLPIMWLIWLTYSLPFDFAYGILTNPHQVSYQLGQMLGLMVLAVVINDLTLLFTSFIVGTVVAVCVSGVSYAGFMAALDIQTTGMFYILAFAFSIVITRKKLAIEREASSLREAKNIVEERNKTMRVLTASIAHELRTPFASAEGIAQTLQENMPKLLQEKPSSAEQNQKLSKAMLDYLRKKDLGNSLSGVVKRAHTFVNMMQQKVNYGDLNDAENQEIFDVLPKIKEALDNYAMEPEEAERVVLIKDYDFKAKGTPLLLQHVILNLLKNALHYTHSKDNAKIEIWLENGDQTNQIHFKDTGQGVDSEDLPHIFEAFFSKTVHGTGVGLAFCKMVIERNFQGAISCESELGEYTHFIIGLPMNSKQG